MPLEFTQRFRRHVAPYDVVTSIKFLAGINYCPVMQTIKSDGTPNIDRSSAPTVLVADVIATSSDNSGSVTSVLSSQVTNIKWYVQKGTENQGKDITIHTEWGATDFTVGTGSDKGRLTINKNIPAGTTWKIWMECDISDTRRGYDVPIHAVTDSILIYTIADASPEYVMSIDRPSAEIYEPALDKKLLYEYKIGNGEACTFNDDGNTHLRVLHVNLRSGNDTLTAGTDYNIKIYKMSGNTRTLVTTSTDRCIESIIGNEIVFNTLFSEDATYQIACCMGSDEVAHKTYGWVWSGEMPTSDEGIITGATFGKGTEQSCTTKLVLAGSVLEHPCVAYRLNWYYRKNNALTYIGAGEVAHYNLTNSAMFPTGSNEAEAVCQVEKKGAFGYLAVNGNRYTDGNGNYYIDN